MINKGIILIEPKSPRLNFLKTAKPFIHVYGKPLIIHNIEELQRAGVTNITVITPQDLRGDLSRVIQTEATEGNQIEIVDYVREDFYKILGKVLVDSSADHHFIVFCGLIFEKNPYEVFPKKKELEILVDKNLIHNKFSGTAHRVKTGLLGFDKLGQDIPDYNAQLVRAYFAKREGAKQLAEILHKNPELTLEDAIMEWSRGKRLGVASGKKGLWYEINSPETVIRAEMLLRRNFHGSRPSKVQFDKLQPILGSSLDFYYQKAATTKVVVEKGVLDRLDTMEIMEPDRTASHHILITDPFADKLLGEKVYSKLTNGGYKVTKFVVPSGEAAKTMAVYQDLAQKIVGLGIDEHSVVFSLGGGAVANVAGFLAATLYRGIGLIHIPTTLMCMVDVAISIKQAVNEKGKNLVGSYYQPLLVLIDPTIPMNETIINHGLSETIKHALAQDLDFYNYLVNYDGDVADVDFLECIIRKTVELKVELMHEDMFENSRGIILQYGHEVGHAMEFLSHFKLTHGEAISIGMRVSAEIAYLMDVTGYETVEAHKKIFKHFHLPIAIPKYINKAAILDSLKYNKKTRGQDIRFALLEFVGKIWKIKGEYGIPVSPNILEEALERSYKE